MDKKRILIVDDDLALSQMVKINLEETGNYEVLVQNCSAMAVTSAREFKPDLILLDYIMPGMDGGDISTKLHEDTFLRRVPVLMVTALVSNSETGEDGVVFRAGHMMVAKPIKFAKLVYCIERRLAAVA